MKMMWTIILLILFVIIGIEKSFAEDLQINEECINMNSTKNLDCGEKFRIQSVEIFSVVDSSVGIFEDPDTKLTVVDLGTFYGLGGNGTIPDTIKVYRDNVIWKTTTKETGIAPSTSHSEWQLPQTFFFNELPGRYKIILLTNNTETFTFEFLVKQITVEFEKNSLETNMNNNFANDTNNIYSGLSPLKQIANGVSPQDVTCKENMQLVFKITDDSPVCVKLSTAEKLIERGWGDIIPIPEPDTGEFRYGLQKCNFIDTNGEPKSCEVEGWTKPVSELDCEEICKLPPTKE